MAEGIMEISTALGLSRIFASGSAGPYSGAHLIQR